MRVITAIGDAGYVDVDAHSSLHRPIDSTREYMQVRRVRVRGDDGGSNLRGITSSGGVGFDDMGVQ